MYFVFSDDGKYSLSYKYTAALSSPLLSLPTNRLGNTRTFQPTLCALVRVGVIQESKTGECACRGYNCCPAAFSSAVLDQLYQSVQNKISVHEPASVHR